MSDTAPIASPLIAAAAAVSAPPVAAPAPVVVDAPPAVAAPAAEAPAAPAAPRVNPWALRPDKPAAPVVETPAADVAPPAPAVAEDPALATLRAQIASLSGVVKAQADDALASVPDGVRKTIESIAGDDPARRLDVLRTMRANGLVAAAPAAVPPGASTMAPPSAPTATAQTNPDALVLAAHARLAGSPIAQSAFEIANASALARARAARPS